MVILIKNGIVVNAKSSEKADVLIENGKITRVESKIDLPTPDQLIDARNCYIFPGGIDPHVHMHLPTAAGFSADDFLTGSRAALYGGTTTLIDFVTPAKGQLLAEAIEERKKEANNCLTNYSLHVSPVEWRENMATEIENCFQEYGLKSFKVYMAYKDSIGLDDEDLRKVMAAVSMAGGMVTVHSELGDEIEDLRSKFASGGKTSPKYHPLSRPAELEAEAVKKAIALAKETNCSLYIVHVSSKESLNHIGKAQKEGQNVIAETCPQYLLLDDKKYNGSFTETAPFVMSPPLREHADNQALWQAIANGTVKTIGTDHCPFSLQQKMKGENDFRKIPNGAGGVEHRLALLYTFGVLKDKISLNKFVEITSTNAARIFGMYPRKGKIAVGSDADILIWDPKKENTISTSSHHQNCDLNIYEGIKTKGAPKHLILKGKIVLKENQLLADAESGEFLKTNSL